jgi:hypothetical protein
MSTISNNLFKLTYMARYYKEVQSTSTAVSYGIDTVKTAFLGEILISWLILLLSLLLYILVL